MEGALQQELLTPFSTGKRLRHSARDPWSPWPRQKPFSPRKAAKENTVPAGEVVACRNFHALALHVV